MFLSAHRPNGSEIPGLGRPALDLDENGANPTLIKFAAAQNAATAAKLGLCEDQNSQPIFLFDLTQRRRLGCGDTLAIGPGNIKVDVEVIPVLQKIHANEPITEDDMKAVPHGLRPLVVRAIIKRLISTRCAS